MRLGPPTQRTSTRPRKSPETRGRERLDLAIVSKSKVIK